ncbi:MAG: non-heme iron oxygenase ferredoxin subunit [Arenicellales bacterium]|nr:non-heme iron oxygenase ferredoxin subunit [Arenicellales bacterium]
MTNLDDFVAVARTFDITPGKMLRVNAHGAWIVVANIENEYFAIADTCSHEDASLYKGVLKSGYIRCPLHGSRFDIKTGQPLEEPAEEPVDVYPVCVQDNVVYIGPPLHEDA